MWLSSVRPCSSSALAPSVSGFPQCRLWWLLPDLPCDAESPHWRGCPGEGAELRKPLAEGRGEALLQRCARNAPEQPFASPGEALGDKGQGPLSQCPRPCQAPTSQMALVALGGSPLGGTQHTEGEPCCGWQGGPSSSGQCLSVCAEEPSTALGGGEAPAPSSCCQCHSPGHHCWALDFAQVFKTTQPFWVGWC